MNINYQDSGMGNAVGLSINDALFYDIFHAGYIFEQDNQYSISDHKDITNIVKSSYPDFMEELLPIFCDIYNHAKLADDGIRSASMVDELHKANLVTNYTNAHPELPDAWDFMEVYFKIADENKQVVVLPHSKKVVELKNMTIEQILKQ